MKVSPLATGKFWFWIVPVSLPTAKVKTWLPKEVSLQEEQRSTLVLLWLGRQLSIKLWKLPRPAWDYNEFMVFVPGIRWKSETYNHCPRLYLDHFLAILSGRLIGYPKQRGKFETSETSYKVCSVNNDLLVEANFYPDEACFLSPQETSGFSHMKSLITNPILQKDDLGFWHPLEYEWGVHTGHAKLKPVRTRLSVRKEILPGFIGNFEVPALSAETPGAFRMETSRWVLDSKAA